MAVSQEILGMNARNYLYIRKYNTGDARHAADNKLETKRRLLAYHIPTPKLIITFPTRKSILSYDWRQLPPNGFVIKPARGWGGGGIIAMQQWDGVHGETITGEKISLKTLESHLIDILDGAYSLQYLPDVAFIEELITPHPFFKKLCPVGLPDVRIILMHRIPVMAMVRLPTRASNGKANLALGALGIGIDMRTGITLHGYMKHEESPHFIPGTKIKIHGIKIPHWDELLLLATRSQEASELGFAGIDMVVDAKQGPMVLEVNARPGLSIQNTNRASLRTRLERVENMGDMPPERGVEVAKSLFSAPFAEKVPLERKTIGIIEEVTIEAQETIRIIPAKIDTGAFRSSIDERLAYELRLPVLDKTVHIHSATGHQARPKTAVTFILAGKRIRTNASLTDRSQMNFPMLIGRRDLGGFIIDPMKNAPQQEVTDYHEPINTTDRLTHEQRNNQR
ncbi:MAG TPA: sugar-transfer associated ATP-grasp domain-containing protein [Patescibacteria group bacterium]|nr:sugar-transfer associated ATP-grasp domain-containing protein [Patescibacteria group bacterium]